MAFVPHATREGYLLNDTPKRIMEAWMRVAKQQKTSLANVLGEILGARYDVPFESSGRPLKSDAVGSASFFVRLPPAVLDEVRAEAGRTGVSMRQVLLDSLAAGFALQLPTIEELHPPRRATRSRAKHGRPKGRKGTPA